MSQPSTLQFTLSVRGIGSTDAEQVEAIADALRTELLDVGADRVEQVSAGVAPADARGVVADIAGVLNLLVTATQTAEALAKMVRVIQRWMAARAQRAQPVVLEVAGVELGVGEAAVGEIVNRLVRSSAPPVATAGDVGVRHALVIANLRYDDAALRGLRAPADDAQALDRVLRDPRIGGFAVDLCVDESEPTIRRRVADFFADRDRDDLLVLHYSGHGVKDSRGRLHLAARDTNLRRLSATAVPASFVNDQMTESASRRVVLILDCCYSGAFARGALVRADRAVHVAEEFGGQGRVVLTASSATEYAFEGDQLSESDGQPSVFTSALVRGLETGAADLDADGEITIDELYDYTYREVRRDQSAQAPMKWSLGIEGSLVLARSVRGAELPAPVLDDLRSNRIGLRLEAVDDLRLLLAGGNRGVRDAARRALDGLREQDDSSRVRAAAAHALTAAAETSTEPAEASPSAPDPSTPTVRQAPPAPTTPAPPVALTTERAVRDPQAGPARTPATPDVKTTVTPPETALPPDPHPAPRGRPPRRTRLPRILRSPLVIAGLIVLTVVAVVAAIALRQFNQSAGTSGSVGYTPVFSVAFSPDGKTVATGSAGSAPQLWNPVTGEAVGPPLAVTGSSTILLAVAFSPDGKTLASAGEDDTVRLWNLVTGQPTGTLAHPYDVSSVAFSRDGKILAAGSDISVRLWSPATGQLIGQPLTGHTSAVLSVAFGPDGKTLASGSGDDTVRLWNPTTGQPVGQPLTGHSGDVVSVAFSPDGKTLASGSLDHTVRLWNPATGRLIGQPLAGHTDLVSAVAFSPDGKILASGGRDGTVRLWDPTTGRLLGQLLTGFGDAWSVAFSPDGKTLASGGGDGIVRLWDPTTGQQVGTLSTRNTPTPSATA